MTESEWEAFRNGCGDRLWVQGGLVVCIQSYKRVENATEYEQCTYENCPEKDKMGGIIKFKNRRSGSEAW